MSSFCERRSSVEYCRKASHSFVHNGDNCEFRWFALADDAHVKIATFDISFEHDHSPHVERSLKPFVSRRRGSRRLSKTRSTRSRVRSESSVGHALADRSLAWRGAELAHHDAGRLAPDARNSKSERIVFKQLLRIAKRIQPF